MVLVPISVLEEEVERLNYQYALLNATVEAQEVLGDKQITDSQAGIVANDLLTTQYDASTEVLNQDTEIAQDASDDSNDFNVANQVYQNDSATTQVGQSNGNTAVQAQQTAVSQDGTNLSNLVSLSSSIISIGSYVSNLISHAY